MAARAIVGIALGMLFLPVIVLFLDGSFWGWITSITVNFNVFLNTYLVFGATTLTIPLITLFGPALNLSTFLFVYAVPMVAWAIIGMWAGAIERSAGRGIGVAVGVWLGWLIIELIMLAIEGFIALFLNLLIEQWFSVVIAIIFAAIIGAVTKSEEF